MSTNSHSAPLSSLLKGLEEMFSRTCGSVVHHLQSTTLTGQPLPPWLLSMIGAGSALTAAVAGYHCYLLAQFPGKKKKM